MKKLFFTAPIITISTLLLASCSTIGTKSASISAVYAVTSVLSVLLLAGYCILMRKKDPWFLLLFSSVFIVNIGYLYLSISRNVNEALLANRISYLGSVLLPLSMLMIIINITNFKAGKRLLWVLIPITIFVYLVAASPMYLDIYYKSVTFQQSCGVSTLCKEYGPWHPLFLFYLLFYFALMIAIILHSRHKKKVGSVSHAIILLSAVLVNMGVWLLEQLVDIGFEFLSVSYIISELFLLGLHLIIQDNIANVENEQKAVSENSFAAKVENTPSAPTDDGTKEFAAHCEYIKEKLHTLTPSERAIYDMYIDGKGTKEIMKQQNITENTLKYHNKNIYSKLWVSSRKQLIEYSQALKNTETDTKPPQKEE